MFLKGCYRLHLTHHQSFICLYIVDFCCHIPYRMHIAVLKLFKKSDVVYLIWVVFLLQQSLLYTCGNQALLILVAQ